MRYIAFRKKYTNPKSSASTAGNNGSLNYSCIDSLDLFRTDLRATIGGRVFAATQCRHLKNEYERECVVKAKYHGTRKPMLNARFQGR